MPPAGAGAEQADLAVEARLRAHPFHRALGVADDLGVRHAAFGAHLGGDVVGVALAGALVEVGADGDVAVVGELARLLACTTRSSPADGGRARRPGTAPIPKGAPYRRRSDVPLSPLILISSTVMPRYVIALLLKAQEPTVATHRDEPQSSGRRQETLVRRRMRRQREHGRHGARLLIRQCAAAPCRSAA